MHTFTIKTRRSQECIDITDELVDIIKKSCISDGICHVYVPHATAAIIINENADPNIQTDFINVLNKVFPSHSGYLHDRIDNNAQSHMIASCLGPSETIPISNGKLQLGTWQAIMLVELDGPRPSRKIHVQIIPAT
ncbi:MAG: YjbQ family protein [Deltaproteobacteria bacterium]|nr:YjbQ family protein [Deltaproteobacteria bacterium]